MAEQTVPGTTPDPDFDPGHAADLQANSPSSRRRWGMLAVGMVAQLSTSVYLYGLAYLIPVMRHEEHISLATAGTVVASPSFGLLCTLVLWGAAADRFGERAVMAVGLTVATGALAAAVSRSGSPLWLGGWLALAGAAGASVNAASGRVVLGWFPAHQRGLAMGMRQMSQPLGMVAAAVTMPPLASAYGIRTALLVPLAIVGLATVLVTLVVRDPPAANAVRGAAREGASPYRTPALYRIHAASALLVIPQFLVLSFGSDYLVSQHGWSATSAGRMLGIVQVLGATTRMVVGRWSDVVGRRLGPMRVLALVNTVSVGALAVASTWHGARAAIPLLIVASLVTVSWNGLAFTAVAEIAGTAWAGRAMGVQNTAQNLTAAVGPPLFGMLIGGPGYPVAYAVGALVPIAAAVLTPPDDAGRTPSSH